ncbi:MAG: hypothetical protein ACYS8W_02255 [Planctomycetota bacterium]
MDAENLSLSDNKIELKLTRAGSKPVLRDVLLTLFYYSFLVILIPLFAWLLYRKGDNEVHIIMLCLLPLSVLALFKIIRVLRESFRSYVLDNESFNSEGFHVGEKNYRFDEISVSLYRGGGNISDSAAGRLEVVLPGNEKKYFSPDRTNFFVLPYLLPLWTGNELKVRPESELSEK